MTNPYRGNTGFGTYFITASTYQKKSLFQSEAMARLFVDALLHYRSRQMYLLHEFVMMPDHFHLLVSPRITLERAIQCIKGGFSYRAKRELGFSGEVWEHSFYDHRVRDMQEYQRIRQYIHQNPVKRGLVQVAEIYPYSSACGAVPMDEVPQRLSARGSRRSPRLCAGHRHNLRSSYPALVRI
jgi:putative transposase